MTEIYINPVKELNAHLRLANITIVPRYSISEILFEHWHMYRGLYKKLHVC